MFRFQGAATAIATRKAVAEGVADAGGIRWAGMHPQRVRGTGWGYSDSGLKCRMKAVAVCWFVKQNALGHSSVSKDACFFRCLRK